jgi:hypothetical protein
MVISELIYCCINVSSLLLIYTNYLVSNLFKAAKLILLFVNINIADNLAKIMPQLIVSIFRVSSNDSFGTKCYDRAFFGLSTLQWSIWSGRMLISALK